MESIKNKTDLDTEYTIGTEVYVWELPEENPDGSPYMGVEHNGQITGYPGNETYLVELYDGNSILVKEDVLE